MSGKKRDNSINDLFQNNSLHFLCHGFLNKCTEYLIDNGLIKFDKTTGLYEINKKG